MLSFRNQILLLKAKRENANEDIKLEANALLYRFLEELRSGDFIINCNKGMSVELISDRTIQITFFYYTEFWSETIVTREYDNKEKAEKIFIEIRNMLKEEGLPVCINKIDTFSVYFIGIRESYEPNWKQRMKEATKVYVLDTSYIESRDFFKEYSNILKSDAKIVLTTITIYELKKLCAYSYGKPITNTAKKAIKVLKDAVSMEEKFIEVDIHKATGSPDDAIIHFCEEYKEKAELLTSDKEMVLLARAKGIKVKYGKNEYRGKIDLIGILDLENGSFITEFKTQDKYVMVRKASSGKKIFSGKHQIANGDEIYLLLKMDDEYYFYHYTIMIKKKMFTSLIAHIQFSNLDDKQVQQKSSYYQFIKGYFDRLQE